MQIGHVAGNVDGRDLSGAVPILAKSSNEPGNNESGVLDALAQTNKVAIGFDLRGACWKREKRPLFISTKVGSLD